MMTATFSWMTRTFSGRTFAGHTFRWGGLLTGALLISGAPALAQTALAQTAQDGEAAPQATRFECQIYQGRPTVMYRPADQEGDTLYPWAVPGDMGGNWPAERRCVEISERLERYRPDGLAELRTGMENGYNTVCVTSQDNPSCRIVFTVPPGQDPVATRDRVFENLTMADSGQATDGVTTFSGDGGSGILGQIGQVLGGNRQRQSGGGGINLRPFLSPADGGTGQFLNRGGSSGGRQLNPNRFR